MKEQKVNKLRFRVFLILLFLGFYKLTIIACPVEISIQVLKENQPDSIISIFGYKFDEGKTKAIIVFSNDSVLFEHCYPGYSEVLKKSASLFDRLSALGCLGIALNEGYIYSINEPVIKYLPELPEEAFSNVSIAQLLCLNESNNEFDFEDFQDKEKDNFNYITKLCCLITKRATGFELNEYVAKRWISGDATVRNGCFFPQGDIVSTCGYIIKHKDWFKIAKLYILLGTGNSLTISDNNLSLHLSLNEDFFIIWIGN